jgi:hypothetical protein
MGREYSVIFELSVGGGISREGWVCHSIGNQAVHYRSHQTCMTGVVVIFNHRHRYGAPDKKTQELVFVLQNDHKE